MHLLTIDVEDWKQIVHKDCSGTPGTVSNRFDVQVERILEMLSRHKTRATFFILGMTAEARPDVIRKIHQAGHELASHGFGHESVKDMTPEHFVQDVRRSIDVLGNITGVHAQGFRAPDFSIDARRGGRYFEILAQLGFRYDSSLFPIRHRRYGNPGVSRYPHRLVTAGGELMEFPLATLEVSRVRLPIAGGGYWRVIPGAALIYAYARLEREGLPAVTYLHPCELDWEAVRAPCLPGWQLKARMLAASQNLGRATVAEKLDRLLGCFRFGAVEDYLNAKMPNSVC